VESRCDGSCRNCDRRFSHRVRHGSAKSQESFDFVAGGLSAEAIDTLTDARMGALKAVLQLEPAQVAL
jgi:hypothetical protein